MKSLFIFIAMIGIVFKATAFPSNCDDYPLDESKSFPLKFSLYYPLPMYGIGSTRQKDYQLFYAVKFELISIIKNRGLQTKMCVGFKEMISGTLSLQHSDDKQTNDTDKSALLEASVEILTYPNVPTGILRVDSLCWKEKKLLDTCAETFYPFPGVMDTAVFRYSPLSQEFVYHFKDEYLPHKKWIHTLKFRLNIETVPMYLQLLELKHLNTLHIVGNEWKEIDGSNDILYLNYLWGINISASIRYTLLHQPYDYNADLHSKLKQIQILRDILTPKPAGTIGSNIHFRNFELPNKTKNLTPYRNTTLVAFLPNLPNLQNIRLSKCQLSFTENTTFTSNFEMIDLSMNGLLILPNGIFKEAVNVMHLYLRDNFLSECQKDVLTPLEKLTALDLSKNLIQTISENCFQNLHNLQALDLSQNKIKVFQGLPLQNMRNLQFLNLSSNRISKMSSDLPLLTSLKQFDVSNNKLVEEPILGPGVFFSVLMDRNELTKIHYLTNLTIEIHELDLSWNKISEIYVSNTKLLNLSYNSITQISKAMWQSLSKIESVDIGGNYFRCCDSEGPSLLYTSYRNILNLHRRDPLTCILEETGVTHYIQNIVKYNLCIKPPEEKARLDILTGAPLGVISICITIISVIIYFYRSEFEYLKYASEMKLQGMQNDDERYDTSMYDAFVCYSGKDMEWVFGSLVKNLEESEDLYRFCLHERDFALGVPIDRNVLDALKTSRKVIFVLSDDFVDSWWCRWEVDMASHKMFSENLNYVIIIELQRLKRNELPSKLRYLMEARTYLEWPDESADEQRIQRCWQRLRNALGASLANKKA